jgi:hypothetical protein
VIIFKDTVFEEILEFFDNCELHGLSIPGLKLVDVDPLAPNAHPSPTVQNNMGFNVALLDADLLAPNAHQNGVR